MFFQGLSVSRGLMLACIWLFLSGLVNPAFSQQKFETAQQTNDRIRELATLAQLHQGDYAIGSGDLLQIAVFDVPELSREVRVGESGLISLPLLPNKVRAAGLTPFELEEKLREQLRSNGLVSHPQITVSIKERRSQPITVIGAVKRPMVYQAIRQTTLLEVISEAGGISDDAASTLLVTRPRDLAHAANPQDPPTEPSLSSSSQSIAIKLNDLLESGDPKYNIPLQGGDVVSVPRGGVIYVVGAVERPGGFVLQNDREQLTTLKALALAGGLKSTAKPSHSVVLRRDTASGRNQELEVNLSQVMTRKSEDPALHANDILFVPYSMGKTAWRRTGEVALSLASGVAIVRAAR